MGEQLLLASFGIIKPMATSSSNITEGEGREQINAVRAWASFSKNHSSSISTTITSTNATPLIVCRQILNSSSLLNIYTSNDHPHLFLRFLTLLTHATSAVADEIKLRASSVGTATSTTSTTASPSSSSIPLSAHRADKLVVDYAYRDITSAFSHSLLTQAPLTASTAEVKKLAALRHNRAIFRLLFDVISASWSFDISSSSTPTPPPPSHADRFSALQHVDSQSINAAADCMLWARGSQKESLAVSDDQLDEKNRKTFTSLISIPSFRSVDYAALYYAAASYSFHRSVKGHQSLFSRGGGGGGGGRFIHPLSSSSSNQLNINGHRNYEDNNYNNDVSHVSRTVRVLLDESSQSSDHHHHHDSLTFNDRIDDRAVTMFNPLDVSAASLSDLCLHLISSQRSQLWTLVRVLSRISLPGADAPISSFSLSSSSASSSSPLVRHRQESRSLLSSKVIVPAALQVKSKKHYSALHDLISAGKFDETVKTLFVLISTPSTANTQRSSTSLTNNSVTQLIASKQTGVNLAPGSVKSSWLAMLSRKNSSTSTSPSSSSSSSNAFSRFRLSQTSVADLVGGRRAVPPSPLSGVSTSLDRTINWGRLNYISDEDLKNVNKNDKGGDNVYSDEIITSNVVSNKNMSNNASNHVTSGGSMIDSSGNVSTTPERLVEEGGRGGGLLAAQMAALQSHTHSDSQEEASIFGDSIISLEKSPLTHVNSAVINDAVLAHLRNSALSSTPHIAPLIINELMRHGVFISPPLADLIAAMAANQFPPSSTTSSSSMVAANEDDDKDSTSASLSSISPLSSFSNHLYLLPLLTHLRAQAAAVISDLPGASQLQKHVPVLGSGLGSAGINHVLNACAAVGALSVAMEILDETAPLYIIPGVSGSAATPTIGSSISSVASRSASVEPIVNRNVLTPDLDALSSLKLLAVKERESGVAIALDILIKKETISNSGGVNSSASSFSFGEGIRGVRSGVEQRDATSSSTLPLQPSQQHHQQYQQ